MGPMETGTFIFGTDAIVDRIIEVGFKQTATSDAVPTTKANADTLFVTFGQIGVCAEGGVELSVEPDKKVKLNTGKTKTVSNKIMLKITLMNVSKLAVTALEGARGKKGNFLLKFNTGEIKIINGVILDFNEKDKTGEISTLEFEIEKNKIPPNLLEDVRIYFDYNELS